MRHFTAASNDRIHFGSAGLAGFDFRWGTIAAYVYLPAFSGGSYCIFSTNASLGVDFWVTGTGELGWYSDPTDRRSTSLIPVATAIPVVATKATGTVTPRFHWRTAAGAWVHQDANGTVADAAATTSVTIGAFADVNGSDQFDGDIGNVAAWPGWNMTDAETERLGAGRWASKGPSFMKEMFLNGDCSGDVLRTDGRARCVQTSRTGTSVGTVLKGPGFLPSIQARRR